jgi:hypothetical protein
MVVQREVSRSILEVIPKLRYNESPEIIQLLSAKKPAWAPQLMYLDQIWAQENDK